MTDDRTGVLVVCAVAGFGGPVRSITEVLHRLGDRVRVIGASQGEVVATNRPDAGDTTSPIGRWSEELIEIPLPRGIGLVRAQLALLRSHRRLRGIDAVHANGLTEAVIVAPLALLRRRPVTVWVHNYAVPRPFALLRRAAGPLLRRWRWTAVSATARSLLPDDWDVDIVPNPIDAPPSVAPADGPAPCQVVYLAGTDHPVKGFDLLADIVEATPPTAARFVVHAARSQISHHPASLATWARLDGALADRVEVRGFVADVSSVLRDADLVLVPSRRESFNRVLAEALAHGVPIVASDIDAHVEHFVDEPVGRLFATDDPGAAATAIRELAADPAERARCAEAGRRRAQLFDPDLVAATLHERWTTP